MRPRSHTRGLRNRKTDANANANNQVKPARDWSDKKLSYR